MFRDNNGTKPQQQQQTSGKSELGAGDYLNQANNDQANNNESTYPLQHQIATTVTNNRPATNPYGGNLQTINPTPSNTNSVGPTPYKLKQQRNYGTNRYDPMGAQPAGYQARNAATAAQFQGQWHNGVGTGMAVTQSPYGGLTANPFGVPHHFQQQPVEMYQNYYGTPQQTAYGTTNAQQTAYGQYGQQMIPPESPKGGHVVYVYGIGQRATQEEILALFQPYGRVLRVDIIIDFNTGLCKGYFYKLILIENYYCFIFQLCICRHGTISRSSNCYSKFKFNFIPWTTITSSIQNMNSFLFVFFFFLFLYQ